MSSFNKAYDVNISMINISYKIYWLELFYAQYSYYDLDTVKFLKEQNQE